MNKSKSNLQIHNTAYQSLYNIGHSIFIHNYNQSKTYYRYYFDYNIDIKLYGFRIYKRIKE